MPEALQQALVINAAVLFIVLEGDLGRHRKVTAFRVLRPLVTAAAVIPLFLEAVATSGDGLTLEVALAAAGAVLGLVAAALMTVYRSPRTGKAVSRVGWGYAVLWLLVVAARSAFSYGSVYWFGPQLHRWLTAHAVTTGALTDGIIFMALAMIVTRTVTLAIRASNLAGPGAPPVASQPAPTR